MIDPRVMQETFLVQDRYSPFETAPRALESAVDLNAMIEDELLQMRQASEKKKALDAQQQALQETRLVNIQSTLNEIARKDQELQLTMMELQNTRGQLESVKATFPVAASADYDLLRKALHTYADLWCEKDPSISRRQAIQLVTNRLKREYADLTTTENSTETKRKPLKHLHNFPGMRVPEALAFLDTLPYPYPQGVLPASTTATENSLPHIIIWSSDEGARLRLLRQERQLTLTQLSTNVYRAPSTLWSYEKGRARPDTFTLQLLAREFGLSHAALIDYLEGSA